MIPVLREIDVVHKVISSDLQDILQALKKSSALLDFLREVVDDDLRNLIDAVEEHSEQYVMESTVSDLIEIKRFFNPVLKGIFRKSLYFNTTGTVPRANQVLFCRKDTTYDEISLLLSRCLQKQTIWATDQSLFAIANIELLPSEVQFSLHNEIRRLSKHLKGYTFLLCLICRGHENHPFLDQFSDMLSRPTPLSDIKLKQFLVEHLSHVKVITSDVPGLGKSEFIQRKSIAEKKRPMCIHISGSFNRLSIIEEMIKVNLKNYHVLHLDIGVVSDPVELDLFLFEMIVLRYASAGSTTYALPYNTIFIEIANTIEDELGDSLPTVTCFAREHLQWNDYNDLRASSEINSQHK
ncbi:RNF213 [Mytilus edulis]|uniref:RNF213 n=1 Tax=Mytilus edulis TaxID=6550 RepID=A0A8S3S531_MYTED|nr:RNF213 [Mytilus edulis]